MDGHYPDGIYPDPSTSFHAPYPNAYQYGAYAVQEPPINGIHGGYYAHEPIVHEGFIADNVGDSEDEDLDDEERHARAQFGLHRVANTYAGAHLDPGLQGDNDDDLDEEAMNDDEIDDELLNYATMGDLGDVGGIDTPEADPDFMISDMEGSADEMSIDGDVASDEEGRGSSRRGRGRGRGGRGPGRGRGRGRGGWKWALKGTEHDPTLAKRGRGRPRGRSRGSQRVPRGEGRRRGAPKGGHGPVEPDQEFMRIQKLATDCYLNNDFEAAASYANEAVEKNPEIFAAYSLLSEILTHMGQDEDALTVLFAGAITKRDAALWWHIGERYLELIKENTNAKIIEERQEQALYAFSFVIKLDPLDYDARVEKLNLLLQMGKPDKARVHCKTMAKLRPHDLSVVRQYAELCALSRHREEINRARTAYERSIEIYSKGKTLGSADEQWSHLYVYIDLVEKDGGAKEAITLLKRLARWLLGRKDETFWDDYQDDDREFDFDNEPRRSTVPAFANSPHANDPSKYGAGLPIELRIKLGMLRLGLGSASRAEAFRHLEVIMQFREDVAEYHDLFRDAANACREYGVHAEAVKFYEPLQGVPDVLDTEYYLSLGASYEALERDEDAEDCYRQIIDNDDQAVEPRIRLAKIMERQGRIHEAVPLINRVTTLGKLRELKKAQLPLWPSSRPVGLAPSQTAVSQPGGPSGLSQPGEDDEEIPSWVPQEQRERFSIFKTKAVDSTQRDVASSLASATSTPNFRMRRNQVEASLGSWTSILDFRAAQDGTPGSEEPSAANGQQAWVSARKRAGRKPKDGAEKSQAQQLSERARERAMVLVEQGQRIQANHFILKSCRKGVDEGDELAIAEWIDAAGRMIEEFRNARVFYPKKERHKHFQGYRKYGKRAKWLVDVEAFRDQYAIQDDAEIDEEIQAAIPKDFYGIQFPEWLDIFLEYAVLQAKRGETKVPADVCEAASIANVWYHDEEARKLIFSAMLASALICNDEETIVKACRWFTFNYPFSNGPYVLFATANRLFSGSMTWFNSGPTQKVLLRGVKKLDYAVLDEPSRKRYGFTGQEISGYIKDDAKKNPGGKPGNPEKITELDPGLLMLYGHIMASATSWPSALNYYFRAYALEPDNVTVNLCIGLSYIQGAMKRQSENRHYQIGQGLAFMRQYYNLRTAPGEGKDKCRAVHEQEAEYNVSRMWHFLGLTHLAVPGYERCLELGAKVKEEALARLESGDDEELDAEEMTQEAAFALAGICAMNDNNAAARALTEKYLTI